MSSEPQTRHLSRFQHHGEDDGDDRGDDYEYKEDDYYENACFFVDIMPSQSKIFMEALLAGFQVALQVFSMMIVIIFLLDDCTKETVL